VSAPRSRRADDDLFRSHSRYLGPPGFDLPVSIPYASFLPGIAAGAGSLIVLSLMGLGPWRFVIAAAIGTAAGALAGRLSGGERRFSSLPSIVAHESGAPRPATPRPAQAVLRPGQLPVRALPPTRTQQEED
jgi:hypothetical protein